MAADDESEAYPSPYTKIVTFHFEAAGETWAVTGFDDHCIDFEDVRKNGQEDSHMHGSVTFDRSDRRWYYPRRYLKYDNIFLSLGERGLRELEDFFNQHGPPKERT